MIQKAGILRVANAPDFLSAKQPISAGDSGDAADK